MLPSLVVALSAFPATGVSQNTHELAASIFFASGPVVTFDGNNTNDPTNDIHAAELAFRRNGAAGPKPSGSGPCDDPINEVTRSAIERHNELRAGARPGQGYEGADVELDLGLPRLEYDCHLQQFASWWVENQKRTANCNMRHSSGYDRMNIGKFRNAGENLATMWGTFKVTLTGDQSTQMWYNEINCYQYGPVSGPCEMCPEGDSQCPKCADTMVGHFTQVMWKASTAIGCAASTCDSGSRVLVACNYGETGNWKGMDPFPASTASALNLPTASRACPPYNRPSAARPTGQPRTDPATPSLGIDSYSASTSEAAPAPSTDRIGSDAKASLSRMPHSGNSPLSRGALFQYQNKRRYYVNGRAADTSSAACAVGERPARMAFFLIIALVNFIS